jgi:hypothetical protein
MPEGQEARFYRVGSFGYRVAPAVAAELRELTALTRETGARAGMGSHVDGCAAVLQRALGSFQHAHYAQG